MANDYTNTSEHYIPVPAITDQWSFTRDITNLRTRLNKAAAGTAAYDSDADNYVGSSDNAGAILSSSAASIARGHVIGSTNAEDPTLSFATNASDTLTVRWTMGVDDSDADKWMLESDSTVGTAPLLTATTDNKIGILLAAPDGTLHVHTASAGAVTAFASADDCIVENSAEAGLSVLTPDANFSYVAFGSPTDSLGAYIRYKHSTASLEVATQLANGIVIINTRNGVECSRFSADGGLFMANQGADPTALANKAAIFAKDVSASSELFALDEAANATQLSQHNPETGEVYHYSYNVRTGRVVRIHLERIMRFLVAHHPELQGMLEDTVDESIVVDPAPRDAIA